LDLYGEVILREGRSPERSSSEERDGTGKRRKNEKELRNQIRKSSKTDSTQRKAGGGGKNIRAGVG